MLYFMNEKIFVNIKIYKKDKNKVINLKKFIEKYVQKMVKYN